MERISEGLPEACAMPRFEDGSINLQELIRRLAEDVANGVMDAEADQRCVVHLMRDCMREARSRQARRRVGRMLAPVFRAKDAASIEALYHVACEMLEGCRPGGGRVLEEAKPDALAYLDFSPSHWKRLRTNNL